ncbi:MAG TPA: cysteine desulfurase [Actinomycetota bacterium]|nr:cysteine desulfurase [Actinomycetota bacterium]
MDAEIVRKDFPLLERTTSKGKPITYLDSAATSQKPRQVLDAVREFDEHYNSNVHRGVYELAEQATDRYEGARSKIASFIGAPGPETIVFNRGTTESVNLVAYAWGRKFLEEGDEILISELEHHSNIVPWQLAARATGAALKYIPVTDEGRVEIEAVEAAISDRTKLVAITGQSNVLGVMPPLEKIGRLAHAAGARFLVDGAQLVPHAPVDVQAIGCDFLTISGHKMLGPTASGGLYATTEVMEEMDVFLGGGEMIEEVLKDEATYKSPPYKFEAGTMNISQEVGLGAAVDYLEGLGMEAVHAHEVELTSYALERLEELGGIRVFGPTDATERGGAISFWVEGSHPHDVATILDEEGVCIRAGHHCAQVLMRRLEVPATARASFNVYTTREDVDRLVEGLEKVKAVFG